MLRHAPAHAGAVGPAEGGGPRMTAAPCGPGGGGGGGSRPRRGCCRRPHIVRDDHEMVCASCGTVSEERLPEAAAQDGGRAESGLLAARVRADDEGAVGTRDVSPPSVLRSRRHRRMLEGARDPFGAALQRACGILSLPPACCRRAARIAHAVRARCAGGAGPGGGSPLRRPCVAYFAIYRTCAEYGVGASEDEMAGAVRAAFAVRRTFRPRRAVFAVEALLVESGGMEGCLGAGPERGGGSGGGGSGGGGGPSAVPVAAAAGPPADAADAARLRLIGSEQLRRSALRLRDSGAPIAVAVEIARRLELIGAGARTAAAAAVAAA